MTVLNLFKIVKEEEMFIMKIKKKIKKHNRKFRQYYGVVVFE